MIRFHRALALLVAGVLAWTTPPAAQQSPEARALQEAIDLVESKGDHTAALKRLELAVQSGDRHIAGRASWYMAQVLERIDVRRAIAHYERVVADFSDQADVASAARSRLAVLAGPAPRASMKPPQHPVDRQLVADDAFRVEQVSADGRTAVGRTSSGDLAVRDLTTHATRTVLRGSGWLWPAISMDGRRIAYATSAPGPAPRRITLHVIDTSSSDEPRTLVDLSRGPTLLPQAWSPDGSEILVMRGSAPNGDPTAPGAMQAAWVSVADGTIRTIRTFEPWQNPNGFALSHDGAWIAYDDVPAPGTQIEHHIFVMDRTGRQPTAVVTLAGANVEPKWSAQGSHLIFLGVRDGSGSLWAVPVRQGAAAGEPVRVRSGFTRGLKIVSTSGSLFYRRQSGSDFETIIADRTASGVSVAQSFAGGSPAISPDGRQVAFLRYLDPRDGALRRRFELTVRSLETGHEQAYSHQGLDRLSPIQWCHDSRCLVMAGTVPSGDGRQQAWLLRLDVRLGTFVQIAPLELQGFKRSNAAALAPDGRTIYLTARRSGRASVTDLIAIDPASGTLRTISELPDGGVPSIAEIDPQLAVSPDGQQLLLQAVTQMGGRQGLQEQLYVINVDGSRFRLLHGPVASRGGRPQWAPDGTAMMIAAGESGSTRVLRVPLDGSPATVESIDVANLTGSAKVASIQPATLRSLTSSLDGRRMAFEVTTAARVELWAIDEVLKLIDGPSKTLISLPTFRSDTSRSR